MTQKHLSLQPSEAHVLHAASRIYAAYVLNKQVGTGTEAQWLEKALSEALHLAQRADTRIQSDEELSDGGLGGSGGLGGGGGIGGGGFSGPPISGS